MLLCSWVMKSYLSGKYEWVMAELLDKLFRSLDIFLTLSTWSARPASIFFRSFNLSRIESMRTNALFQEHSAPHSQLHPFTLGSCPVQTQSDLFATEQPHWSSRRLSALLNGTAGAPLYLAVKETMVALKYCCVNSKKLLAKEEFYKHILKK